MSDIYTKNPINKIAAKVVSQIGCTENLTNEQKRANLVEQWKLLQHRISSLPKNSLERKRLGKDFSELGLAISAIRKKKKGDHDLQHYIVEIVRERMTQNQWCLLMDEAVKRKKAKTRKIFKG